MLRGQNSIYYVISIIIMLCVTITFLQQESSVVANSSEVISATAEQYLQSQGYQIGGFIENQDVVIPAVFDKVYKKYNEIQKKAGYDLTKYRGKKVVRYTYSITNYPGDIPDVRANLLFYNGQIIGGDIMSVKLDGFMEPLKNAAAQ